MKKSTALSLFLAAAMLSSVLIGCENRSSSGTETTDEEIETDEYSLPTERKLNIDCGSSLADFEKEYILKAGPSPLEGKGTPVQMEKVSKSFVEGVSKEISLDGTWDMVCGENLTGKDLVSGNNGWAVGNVIPAGVPGSVHTALLEAGMIEDPYYSLNDAKAKEMSFKDWWMRKTFTLSKKDLGHLELKFGGVCETCTVYFNGTKLGTHTGMFGGPDFDISSLAVEGENTVIVHIKSAPNRARERGEMPTFFGGGNPWLNLGWCDTVVFNCCYGWHYCDIPALGIWRSVTVEKKADIEIENPFIATAELDGSMEFYTCISSAADFSGKLKLSVTPKNFKGASYGFEYNVSGTSGSNDVRLSFSIPNPRLWWPNGYGEQNLYILSVGFVDKNGDITDSESVQFGIRTIEMLPYGETGNEASENIYNWKFVINGTEMFVKGAGWCTTDALMRFSTENYDKFLSLAKAQNLNMLRAWGGGLVETDEFYDLCDEYGICVFQEWPTAWDSYEVQPKDALLETVEINTLRLRNRASLVMWCGGNEGVAPLSESGAYDPAALNEMGKLTLQLDGTRPWHRQELTNGSIHDYSASWGGQNPSVMMTLESIFFGEFGVDSLPNIESVYRYTPSEEIASIAENEGTSSWSIPQDSVIAYHTPMFNKSTDLDRVLQNVDLFLPLNSLENAVLGSQIAQAVGVRYTVERARTRFPDCTGTIMYKLNDIYPAASWATVDWYGSPKYAFYVIQDSYEPLTAIARFDTVRSVGKKLDIPLYVVDDANKLAKASSWKASVKAYGSDGKIVAEKSFEGSGSVDRLKLVGTVHLTEAQTNSVPLYIISDITVDGVLKGRNTYFINYEDSPGCLFEMPKTTLQIASEGNTFTVTNTGIYPAINVNFVCGEVSDTFRPEDSFFWLEPGESKKIAVNSTKGVTGVTCWNYSPSDDTAPSAPTDLTAKEEAKLINLEWSASEDKETGITLYEIFRNGEYIGSVNPGRKTTVSYTDAELTEQTECRYDVYAVNGAGMKSSAASVTAKTLPDAVAPKLILGEATPDGGIRLVFDEALDKNSAKDISKYTVDGYAISKVIVSDDGKSVIVVTNPAFTDGSCTVHINGIEDASMQKNALGETKVTVFASLLGCWEFNEGEGSKTEDSTGKNSSVALSGIGFGEGRDGTSCLVFDNVVEHTARIENCALNPGNTYSIAADIKADSCRDGENVFMHVIVAKNSKTDGHFEVYIASDGTLHFYSPDYTYTDGSFGDFGSGVVVDDGIWHNIAVTVGGNVLTFYVDGNRAASHNFLGTIRDTSSTLAIGGLVSEGMFPFNGSIDNLYVYNRVLTNDDITGLNK